MKVSELYEQVSRLGFEDSLDDGKSFYHSANRALMQVGAIRPAVGACVINHNPLPNLLGDNFLTVEGNDELIYEMDGAKAYYFEVDGSGSYVIQGYNDGENGKDGEWINIGGDNFTSVGKFTPCRGLLKNFEVTPRRARIVFTSGFRYRVRNIAFYDTVYSDNPEDVPAFEPYTFYNIADLAKDFLTFSSPPVHVDSGYDKMSIEYTIEGTNVVLSNSFSGTVRVLYNRQRKPITYTVDATKDTKDIDLDEELASLMPLLVASYVWLEDEEGKAAYYMNLYRERVADIERRNRNHNSFRVKNIYGW